VRPSISVSFAPLFDGAATWRHPHVMCLDEPSNYLDRESLAALIEALKVFESGVLVITHNRDFSESLCKEVWAMRDGRLEASGHNWVDGQGSGPRIDKAAGDEADLYDDTSSLSSNNASPWVAKQLAALLGDSEREHDSKLIDAVLSALAALAKENPTLANALAKPFRPGG